MVSLPFSTTVPGGCSFSKGGGAVGGVRMESVVGAESVVGVVALVDPAS